jgi:Cu/Ag efflux protein CusF
MRFLTVMVWILAMLALVAAPVLAQTQAPSASPARPAPGAPAAEKAPEKPKEVEGTVKKVDPATKSVQVSSGLLGLFGATLEVDDQTKINVQGKDKGSIADIQEGAKVKASYESRDGKNVAKTIDVMAEDKPSAPARPSSPGATAPAPGSGSPAPGAAPSTGQPKTTP